MMRPRIAILGIYHETNTFVQNPIGIEQFNCIPAGSLRTSLANAHHEIGGMYEVFDAEEVEIVDVFFADATPGGRIGTKAYEQLLNSIQQGLQNAFPLHGCMLAGHGAAVGELIDDLDGHWFKQVRTILGKEIPLIATLDPHANLSPQMVDATNAIFAYKTNPHTDQRDTGKRAARAMLDIINGKLKPVQTLVQLPLAISIEQQCNYLEPCRTLYEMASELEKEPQVIQVNIMLGFLYADVKKMGSSILVVTNENAESGANVAARLENQIRKQLSSFSGEKIRPEQAMEKLAKAKKPVLFLDMGDNIGGGSPGNSTLLLQLLNKSNSFRFFICLYDPAAVQQAIQVGVGQQFTILLKDDYKADPANPYLVRCLRTAKGTFSEDKPVHGGKTEFDMGPIAIVETEAGGLIMLTSRRMPPFSLKQLTHFGINPETFDVIIAKGVNAPLAAYKDVCATVIQVDTPGITQADATRFYYLNRKKPMFPFESIEECNAANN